MKPHGIKVTDADWQTMQSLATKLGFKSVNALINHLCQQAAESNGETWQGGSSWGSEPGSNRGRWKEKQENE
jgi:hypothetical protein